MTRVVNSLIQIRTLVYENSLTSLCLDDQLVVWGFLFLFLQVMYRYEGGHLVSYSGKLANRNRLQKAKAYYIRNFISCITLDYSHSHLLYKAAVHIIPHMSSRLIDKITFYLEIFFQRDQPATDSLFIVSGKRHACSVNTKLKFPHNLEQLVQKKHRP